MKKCQFCLEIIQDTDSRCPHCTGLQRNARKKNWLFFAISGLLLVSLFLSRSVSTEKSQVQVQKEKNQVPIQKEHAFIQKEKEPIQIKQEQLQVQKEKEPIQIRTEKKPLNDKNLPEYEVLQSFYKNKVINFHLLYKEEKDERQVKKDIVALKNSLCKMRCKVSLYNRGDLIKLYKRLELRDNQFVAVANRLVGSLAANGDFSYYPMKGKRYNEITKLK